jgi:glycosyltransferase involved in cell wall biosynthesis
MKIAIVAGPYVPIPPPKYGGTEQVVHYLIKGLLEAGHEPILLGAGDSEVNCRLIPIVDKAVYFPKHKKDIPEYKIIIKKINAVTNRKLRELLPEIDIIHSHGFDLKRFKTFPNVTTLHNKIEFDQLDYYLHHRYLNFVSISKNQQGALEDLKYVGVVYNGEDPDQFPIVTEPEDYVCFLGRFDRDKNPHLAIQLAISMNIKIKLAGKIDFEGEDYFGEVEKYFDHPLVEYLGELGFDEKVELLSKARCNLHPTNFREPFGLTVLEAAYCGTPTLAVSRGSMPELIEPGRTGVLVEDFIEGRSHIEECFAMDRKYIASRARQLFNYRTMTDQYLRVYEKVMASMPKSSDQPTLLGRVARLFSGN